MAQPTYKSLARNRRKAARKALSKGVLLDDAVENRAALEWGQHVLTQYLGAAIIFALITVGVALVSRGRYIPISFWLIIFVIGYFAFRPKVRRFGALVSTSEVHATEAHNTPTPPPVE